MILGIRAGVKTLSALLIVVREFFTTCKTVTDVPLCALCTDSSIAGGNLTAVYGADGFGDLFIWEGTKLYYSPNGGMYIYT